MDENGYIDENESGMPRLRTKSETLAELRRKEHGQKHEMTKVDYTSHLKKTEKPENVLREKKKSNDTPNYLQHLRKTETGISTQPEYIRLAKNAEAEGKQSGKRVNAEDLINMAFKKAADAEERDPAKRRGIANKSAGSQKATNAVGSFEGIKVTSDTKEDYRSALKQHVQVERKAAPKKQDEKPSWANVTPKKILDADIMSKSKEVKQEKPEWAQFVRGTKKNILGLEQSKSTEKSQAPEWADLANKTDRKRLIQLESKKSTNSEAQPEWAGKARDPKEILRVELKTSKKSTGEESPDYKGVLRRGSRKE